MNDFIEAMIKGHDKSEYLWVGGKCAEVYRIPVSSPFYDTYNLPNGVG
ncbi:hypothetical protein ACFL3O_01145 [Candidatus Neomarinimicrobiota bacterium]